MIRLWHVIEQEFFEVLPPTIFFLVTFHIVLMDRALMLREYGLRLSSMAVAVVMALLVAKVVLIADKLPFINRFPEKPLIYNVVWKTAIYVAASLFVHYLEHLVPLWWQSGEFRQANRELWREIVWPHFWAIQLWLIVLIFVYCATRELVRIIGRERIVQIYFGSPPSSVSGGSGHADPRPRATFHDGPTYERRIGMRQTLRTTLSIVLFLMAALPMGSGIAGAQSGKPNILVIWGDDIGTWNISHNNRGMMGYLTPNIDRIAREGVSFTDYYGQQSCTAGRAAFLSGSVPVRTGMTKVGLPGAKEGWQKTDVTIATVMKSLGYATGQFGKNHQGDRDEHLPTVHGFDEFFGSLYHLNAEEEPENIDYPKNPEFLKKFGPRGVLRAKADGRGGQTIQNTGPLTRKRMETVDEETLAAAKEFVQRQVKDGKPFFVWWNATRMHFRTHVKAANRGISGQDEYSDGMVEHDRHVGELLKLLDDMGLAGNTIVFYSTDNGPHYNTWPDAGTTPFRSEKNSNWEGAYRVPAFVRWPGKFPAGTMLNGIVAHEDWLPTFAAIAGDPSINDKIKKGATLNGRSYRNHPDGYDMTAYLSGQVKESPRKDFIYVNDDGQIVAMRYTDWKVVFLENRGEAFAVWREPFTDLRVPLLFNLRRDPFEKAQHNSNTYNDWFLDRPFVIVPLQGMAAEFLKSMKEYPPSQTPGSFNLEKIQKQIEAASKGGS